MQIQKQWEVMKGQTEKRRQLAAEWSDLYLAMIAAIEYHVTCHQSWMCFEAK